MIYLHYYETESEFIEGKKNDYEEPWTSYTEETDRVDYNDPYLSKPFTVKVIGSGDISWNLNDKTLSYSKNNGTWDTMTSATTIQVVDGDEIQFKGTNANYCGNTFASTTQFIVEGNIMSLLDADGFKSAKILSSENAFNKLFLNNTNLTLAENLKLPAKEITGRYAYHEMFRGCTNLVKGPELPATKLSDYCYIGIFFGCQSLLVAPELPAMELAESCYKSGFTECYSIQKAPELPATTLAASCYSHMFQNCTGLTETMEILPAMTLKQRCYEYMFNGCTNITTAPVLPATRLAQNCYIYMFSSSSKLAYIKAMFTTTPGTSYTKGWVTSVASTGTFVKNSSATWTTTGNDGVPSGWTVQRETPSE